MTLRAPLRPFSPPNRHPHRSWWPVLQSDELAALVGRHKSAQAQIAARTGRRVELAWDDLGSWDRADIERFAALIDPHISAAKKAAVVLAIGFYARILQTRPPAIAIATIDAAYNAESGFTATWHALSEGRPFDEAVVAGRSAASAQVERFVASAARRTGDHVATATRFRVAWKRVPSAAACPFCVRVSGQTYKTSETADFGHDRCGCTAVPVAL